MPPAFEPTAGEVAPMHQETTNRAGVPREMSVARWLFNPFVRIGGEQALAIGLSVIVVSGLVAAAGGVHFDGLLDFHPGYSVSFWVPVVEGLVNWSVISVLLVPVSLVVAPRTVRLVDIAGTQALARVPAVARGPRVRPGTGPRWERSGGRRRGRGPDGDADAGEPRCGAVCRRLRDLDGLAHVEGVRRCLQPAGGTSGGGLRGGGHRGGAGDEVPADPDARELGARGRARRRLTPATADLSGWLLDRAVL